MGYKSRYDISYRTLSTIYCFRKLFHLYAHALNDSELLHMLAGLPGNPLPLSFDEKVSKIAETFKITSTGPDLPPGKRGLILPSPIEVIELGKISTAGTFRQTSFKTHPDSLDLRQALLFWDAIHLPEEVTPIYERDTDISFLESCGIIRRYNGPQQEEIGSLFGGNVEFVLQRGTYPIYSQLRLNLFSHLEKKEPEQWAMARGVKSPEIPRGELLHGRGALVTLTNMLPIPSGNVHLGDVMEFKLKRSSELESLQDHIADIHGSISEEGIDAIVSGSRLRKFERSIKDFQLSIKETGFPSVLSDLASSFNVASAGIAVAITILAPTHIVPVAALAVAGALTVEPLKRFARRKTGEEFEYVSKYHTDLNWHST